MKAILLFALIKLVVTELSLGVITLMWAKKSLLEATKTFLLNNCGFDHEKVQYNKQESYSPMSLSDQINQQGFCVVKNF